jgi:hypothetical protein
VVSAPQIKEAWQELAAQHSLVLNPFNDNDNDNCYCYRARIFAFSDSAVIGDTPMTTSVRKARQHCFFGTTDSYQSVFEALHELARLRLIPAPVVKVFSG